MNDVTKWVHKTSDEDTDFATQLLQTSWRVCQEPPLGRYTLAQVLEQIGMELKGRAVADPGLLWHAQRYIDMGGWLNAPQEDDDLLEPPVPVHVSVLRWWWYRLRRRKPSSPQPPLDVVLTAPSGSSSECVFVDVVRGGRSVHVGPWVDRPDGMVALRIPEAGN